MRQIPHFYHSKGNTCTCLPTKPLVQAILHHRAQASSKPISQETFGMPSQHTPTPLHPPVEPKPNKGEAAMNIWPSRKPKPCIVATKQINATATARPKPHTTGIAQNRSRHSRPQPRVLGIRGVMRKTWDQYTFPFKMPNLVHTQNGTG